MKDSRKIPIIFAVAAAVCYSISAPFSKLLMTELSASFMAALLYLGAGFGMTAIHLFRGKIGLPKEASITKRELRYVVGMILLDIAAPIALMFGLTMTTPANASLLNNFEIVATSMVALIIFKEAIGARMWTAISLITISSIILSFESIGSLSFSAGSLLVIAACICWGFENNCTRMLSLKNPLQIVIIKGMGSGIGSLIIVIALKEYSLNAQYIFFGLLLGFVAYGMSVYFYILAQRELGAARTSAYYAFAPFIGAGLSFVIFDQAITLSFLAAVLIMACGVYFAAFEKHKHMHIHDRINHEHKHKHTDGHHNHQHDYTVAEHSHQHEHEQIEHEHPHLPDMHHPHSHK